MSHFINELKKDPVTVSYRPVEARKLVSGQDTLKTIYGTGTLNELVVKEGDVLNENIRVVFRPYKGEILFRKTDRVLIDRVLEVVQAQYDKLTSSGVCVKPLYSRPKGYKSSSGSGSGEVFIYEIIDLLADGKVSLPYYLYTKKNDGTALGGAVPILARRIRVRIHGNVYSEFKPGNVTVSEVIDLVKKRYEEYKPVILNTRWGLLNTKDMRQPPRGHFKRTLSGIEYQLSDLLTGKSFLPVSITGSSVVLSDNVTVCTTIDRYQFARGTDMTVLWTKWTPRGPDTSCECGRSLRGLCILDPNLLITGKDKLPTAKGLVTDQKVIVEWSTKDVLCFDKNTPVEHILWTIRRLRRSNDPERFEHKFVGPDMRTHSPDQVVDDDGELVFEQDLPNSILIRFGPSLTPLYLHNGMKGRDANTVYQRLRKEANDSRNRNMGKAHMWVVNATKRKNTS